MEVVLPHIVQEVVGVEETLVKHIVRRRLEPAHDHLQEVLAAGDDGLAEHLHVGHDVSLLWRQRWRGLWAALGPCSRHPGGDGGEGGGGGRGDEAEDGGVGDEAEDGGRGDEAEDGGGGRGDEGDV